MNYWTYLRLFTNERTRREGTLRAICSSFEDASPEQSLRKAAIGRTTEAKRRLQHAEPQVRSSIAQMFQCVNCFLFEGCPSFFCTRLWEAGRTSFPRLMVRRARRPR